MRRVSLALVGILLAGCSIAPAPTASPGATIDCGPLTDTSDCTSAIAAATTILSPDLAHPTTIVVRYAVPADACAHWFHPCGSSDIVIAFHSGGTQEDVPMIRTTDNWIPMALMR